MKEVTMLKADGFDAAILGIGSRCGKPDILIYDYNKCCDILMERDDMTREEAIEWTDFNVVGLDGNGNWIIVMPKYYYE
jgi:hypothetical protein